jgi:hypothetical protein
MNSETQCTYEVFYNNRRTEIKALTLYEAKKKAIEFFHPRKSQEHMIVVVLIDNGKGEVTINNSNVDFG